MKKIIYIDMDDTICQYREAFNVGISAGLEYPQAEIGFFKHLKPISGSIASINLLKPKYDVWILTAPSIYNPLSYTEKRIWVEYHLGFEMCSKLIICPNKGLMIGRESYKCERQSLPMTYDINHILIDDIISGKGQENFQGDLIQYGSINYPDWASIIETLI